MHTPAFKTLVSALILLSTAHAMLIPSCSYQTGLCKAKQGLQKLQRQDSNKIPPHPPCKYTVFMKKQGRTDRNHSYQIPRNKQITIEGIPVKFNQHCEPEYEPNDKIVVVRGYVGEFKSTELRLNLDPSCSFETAVCYARQRLGKTPESDFCLYTLYKSNGARYIRNHTYRARKGIKIVIEGIVVEFSQQCEPVYLKNDKIVVFKGKRDDRSLSANSS